MSNLTTKVERSVGTLVKDPKIRHELEDQAENKNSPIWKIRSELATDLVDGDLQAAQPAAPPAAPPAAQPAHLLEDGRHELGGGWAELHRNLPGFGNGDLGRKVLTSCRFLPGFYQGTRFFSS